MLGVALVGRRRGAFDRDQRRPPRNGISSSKRRQPGVGMWEMIMADVHVAEELWSTGMLPEGILERW
ncbi:hypothetical protein, partial [Pseudomonas sp. GW460-R15]|uniref:hypothetical protein n=1 Tax=Pseudomonas sp. GW460-R15 TaxID=2075557 RepID=UPI001C487063